MAFESEPILKVGILLKESIVFQLKGNFTFKDKIIESGTYTAKIEHGVISTDFLKGERILLEPANLQSSFLVENVTIGIGFHWEKEENQEFEGGLNFMIEDGKVRLVNTVRLESYLKSVISSEMSAMNDLTLLKVHAIVSRSWLLAQLNTSRKEGKMIAPTFENTHQNGADLEITKWYDREDHSLFDVCADDHCQRYQGITRVVSDNAKKAVDQTRGMVLMHDSEICDARFSKCCGGISEDFENVWQNQLRPYLTSIQDSASENLVANNSFFRTSPPAFCNTTDPKILNQILVDFDRETHNFYRWKVIFKNEKLTALLKKKSDIDFGEIIDIVPLERGKSGRIIRLEIIGTKRTVIVGKELEIRKWFSESHLYSAAFTVEKHVDNNSNIPSQFTLYGAGWGHGVGMCQIGAAVMSHKGYSVNQILQHYFLNSVLNPIY